MNLFVGLKLKVFSGAFDLMHSAGSGLAKVQRAVGNTAFLPLELPFL